MSRPETNHHKNAWQQTLIAVTKDFIPQKRWKVHFIMQLMKGQDGGHKTHPSPCFEKCLKHRCEIHYAPFACLTTILIYMLIFIML